MDRIRRMHRLLAAAAALATGGALAAALIASEHVPPAGREVLVVVRDLPAGASLTEDAVRSERTAISGPTASALVTAGALAARLRTTHALAAGQLLQRSDVATAASGDSRLVLLEVKDVPPLVAGDRVDLLAVSGAGEHSTVTPFLEGVEVRAAGQSGIVVAVPARAASALVYASSAARLVVLAGAGLQRVEEPAVASFEDALAQVRR